MGKSKNSAQPDHGQLNLLAVAGPINMEMSYFFAVFVNKPSKPPPKD